MTIVGSVRPVKNSKGRITNIVSTSGADSGTDNLSHADANVVGTVRPVRDAKGQITKINPTSEGGGSLSHAEANVVGTVRPIRDSKGRITQINLASEAANDELKHYGVKGMTWGVRRSEEALAAARGRRKAISEAQKKHPKKTTTKPTKTASEMSTKELQDFVNRNQLETKYNKIVERTKPRQSEEILLDYAKDFVGKTGKNYGDRQAQNAANTLANVKISDLMKKR